MNILWLFGSGLLTLIAVLLTLWPLLRPRHRLAETAMAHDIARYKSQLEEVAHDLANGTLSPVEAETAHLEISRRLLKADKKNANKHYQENTATPSQSTVPWLVRLAIIALIPAISFGLYGVLGAPSYPDMPLASRTGGLPALLASENRLRQHVSAGQQRPLAPLQIDKPADLFTLGQGLMAQQRFGDAVLALRQAVALDPATIDFQTTLGEALISQASGRVTPAAVLVFETAQKLKKNDVKTQYYLATYDYQQGRVRRAVQKFQALLQTVNPSAPWHQILAKTLDEIARQQAVADNFAPEQNNPLPEAVASMAESLKYASPAARQQQIEQMVAGLAARLKQKPDDLAGWLRLIHAYGVLQDQQAAAQAYKDASNAFPQNIAVMIAYARNLRKWAGNQSTATTRNMMQQVLQRDANHFEANWFLGLWAFRHQQLDTAKQHFRIVLSQLDSQDPNSQEMRQQIQSMLK